MKLRRILFWGFLIILLSFIGLLISQVKYDIPVEKLKAKYTNNVSKFVEVEGLNVHYRSEGSGMPLVLLHGTASSLHTWNVWTDILHKDFTVIRLDLPAFALTGPFKNDDYSIDHYVDFLHKFLEKIDVDSCYLAGNSLGGSIAWSYAVKYPSEVKKLVLLDSGGYPNPAPRAWAFRLASTPVINIIARWITPASMFKKNLTDVYYDDSKVSDSLVQLYQDMLLREGNRQAFIDRAKTQFVDNSAKIKEIKIPTLIIWGKEDPWIIEKYAYQFEKDLVNSKLIIYPKVGHVPMEELPVQTAEDTKKFLKD